MCVRPFDYRRSYSIGLQVNSLDCGSDLPRGARLSRLDRVAILQRLKAGSSPPSTHCIFYPQLLTGEGLQAPTSPARRSLKQAASLVGKNSSVLYMPSTLPGLTNLTDAQGIPLVPLVPTAAAILGFAGGCG